MISEAFTVAPEVVYSPIVPLEFATNRVDPDTAMPAGPPLNPVISDAFTVAPEVVYSPIVPLAVFVTNRFDPDTAMPNGSSNPVISEAFSVAPEVVYSPIVPLAVFVTNRFDPDTAKKAGLLNPEISAAFIVAPEVVYSPIVPLPSLVTKMLSPRAIADRDKTATATETIATAHRPETIVARVRRNERIVLLLSKQQVSGAGVHRGSTSRGHPPTPTRRGPSQSSPAFATFSGALARLELTTGLKPARNPGPAAHVGGRGGRRWGATQSVLGRDASRTVASDGEPHAVTRHR